jgi:hypothetical protein
MLPTLLLLAALPGADTEPAKVQPPTPKFTGLTANGTLGFEVSNPNADPLPYIGYTRDSYNPPIPEGEIRPLYRAELLKGKEWKDHQVGWGKTGVGPVTLPAKGTVKMEVHVPPGEWDEVKVGLVWAEKLGAKGAGAWSEPVSRKVLETKP